MKAPSARSGLIQGFTLLEMLIAVVLIAVVGTTISSAVGSVANQTHAMERRTLASWVAQNSMTRLRLDLRINPRVLPEGKDSARYFMGEREWDVLTEVKSTDSPLLRRVEIDVYEVIDGDRQGPYDHLVAFLGRN